MSLLSAAPTPAADYMALAVRQGLTARPKWLPPWLFYDDEGSRLFDEITRLPEYYLTRTERDLLAVHAGAMIARAAEGHRLRIVELGAGSADKTRLLLDAATLRQQTVLYEPMDVSASALEAARERIERENPAVRVAPLCMDYTRGLDLDPTEPGERRLVLYIGSSIGNFEPDEALRLLRQVRARLNPGDGLLLGVDLVKDAPTLLAAYNDAAGVTAAFNQNLLTRLNRELGAEFDLSSFAHRAVWNAAAWRIEMHLVSRIPQQVSIKALDREDLAFAVDFTLGESIHTENSYKYASGQAEALLASAGFAPVESWTDDRGWFAVCLGRAQ